MDRSDFTKIMVYISASCGKPMNVETAEVYYDLLGDLPVPVLQSAAKQACLENTSGFFPPVGVLRRLAVRITSGNEITWGEAWELGLRAVRRFGDKREAGLASLPLLVRQAVKCFGWQALGDVRNDEIEYAREQFRKLFDPLAARENRTSLLPPMLAQTIKEIGHVPNGLLEEANP